MLRLVTDENFHGDIVTGLFLRKPDVELVRVQDVGLMSTDDPIILEWAAQQRRVVLTHDVTTMTRHAYDRVRDGRSMPGVIEVPDWLPIGQAIEDLLILMECSFEGEWEGQVKYLPL